MGKGSRARAQRAQDKINNPEQYARMEKERARKRKQAPKWIAPLVALVLVLAIIVGVTFSILNTNGIILRSKTAVTSENYEVTGTMMSVYYNGILKSSINNAYQYAYYYSQVFSSMDFESLLANFLKFDPNKALNKQVKDESTGETWFDYYMSVTKDSVNHMLVYCEAAKAEGFTLTDEDRAEIDEQIEAMKKSASESNVSLGKYLASYYGTGVKEDDFRAAYELQLLASKYQKKIHERLEDSIKDEDVEKYYGDHKLDYSAMNYICYTANTKDEELVEAAKKLETATTTEDFKTMLTEFIKQETGEYEGTEEEQLAEIAEKIESSTKKLAYSSSSSDNYEQWMFTGEWKGDAEKNPGEVKVGKTVVVKGDNKCTVYHILTLPDKNTSLIEQNVSYITIAQVPENSEYLTADEGASDDVNLLKVLADKMLEDFKAGAHDDAAMKALADAVNQGVEKDTDKLAYKKIETYSSSSKVGVTEVDNWIADAKVGDYTLIKAEVATTEKDENGKTINKDVYYLALVNDGTESWYEGCFNEVLENLEDEWYKDASSKHSVNFDDKVCGKYSSFN